eukprot:Phypoly_transcript_24621.p1 GENE.Phypoly_transcript_24621~~Phypoly_transcript_24621.p1  ORF type:complete len:112 (-),score=6.68 Phypoly_transcript_24621:104-439(-)
MLYSNPFSEIFAKCRHFTLHAFTKSTCFSSLSTGLHIQAGGNVEAFRHSNAPITKIHYYFPPHVSFLCFINKKPEPEKENNLRRRPAMRGPCLRRGAYLNASPSTIGASPC